MISDDMRGVLTPEISKIAEKWLGRTFSQVELRLYAYLDYVMKNDQRIDIRKINQEEREVLSKLKKDRHIEGGAGGLSITKEFYDFMNQILWLGYVVGGSISEEEINEIMMCLINEN